MRVLLVLPLVLVGGAVSLATPPHAQSSDTPAAGEPERYKMTPIEGGFLRLDTQTGSLSFCGVADGQSFCRAGADEKAALEAEISRLRRENAELRKTWADAAEAPRGSPGLPSEEEFERTLSMTERFLRRVMKVFREEAPGEKCPR